MVPGHSRHGNSSVSLLFLKAGCCWPVGTPTCWVVHALLQPLIWQPNKWMHWKGCWGYWRKMGRLLSGVWRTTRHHQSHDSCFLTCFKGWKAQSDAYFQMYIKKKRGIKWITIPVKAVEAQSHDGKAESSSKGLHVEMVACCQFQIPGMPFLQQSKFFNRHNSKTEG